ncbi:hypothetical protein ACFOGJ_16095 [Marinibaculum pumilum]|uniref:YgiT-type zinc finger protein n=1 Tax=Marinibaculum pumilum TaxID=1766165 RepID=A0ABV7L269_9PROT
MPASCCGRCGGEGFEVVEGRPAGAHFRIALVQCASCGAVVGAMPAVNVEDQLRQMDRKLQTMDYSIQHIASRR